MATKTEVSPAQIQKRKEAMLADLEYFGKILPELLDIPLQFYAMDNGKSWNKLIEDFEREERKEKKRAAKEAIRLKREEGLKNLELKKHVSIDHKDAEDGSLPVSIP
jgi:hypothetical protein